ncbi:MAG: pyridoxamine 5'-phosphate oxidase [Bacteroidetes bacterium]|nr:pyridoxamine 5'-phosphate oxidase [Bacteroidota bacterium]
MIDIAALRKEYSREELTESSVSSSPFEQFSRWFDEAMAAELPEPTAMTLATVSESGQPSARVVLLKGITDRGFIFYSNYASHKGQDLDATPLAALLFFWPELERQIRIEGWVEQLTSEESNAYFSTRPLASQIGAWASEQSSVVPSKAFLEQRYAEMQQRFADGTVPLPPTWGGYRVIPATFEFWQGRPSRMHDRIRYRRNEEDGWEIERLSP